MDPTSHKRERSEGPELAETPTRADAENSRAAELCAREAELRAREAALSAREAELGDDTTFGAVLDSSLPMFEDLSRLDLSGTDAVGAMVPKEVIFWDLREEMDGFRKTLPETLMRLPVKKMTRPGITGNFQVVQEDQIVALFVESAGKALNMLCQMKGDPIKMTAAGGFEGRDRDRPDIFCIYNGEALACGEVKRRNLHEDGDNLAERYRNKDPLILKTVHQVTGYQAKYKTEYAFITTFDRTWITKLTTEGFFWISEAFKHDQQGPQSTLNALLFAVGAALNSRRRVKWVSPNLKRAKESVPVAMDELSSESAGVAASGSDQGGEGNHRSSTSTTKTGGSVSMLRLESVMQQHPDRITYMARTTEDNAFVAVKCYESRELRDLEASFYWKLASLQGAHIPRYLGSGLLGDGDTSRRFALILTWVGDDLEGGESVPPPCAWKQAREALLQIHALGVLHGDLEQRNVTYDPGSGRVFFCDFSHALTSGALGPAEFAAARAQELNSFDRLMASVVPDSPEEAVTPRLPSRDGEARAVQRVVSECLCGRVASQPQV